MAAVSYRNRDGNRAEAYVCWSDHIFHASGSWHDGNFSVLPGLVSNVIPRG